MRAHLSRSVLEGVPHERGRGLGGVALPFVARDDAIRDLDAAVRVGGALEARRPDDRAALAVNDEEAVAPRDRKSTRLNSSHLGISYAGLCLKKKNTRR